MTFIFTIRNESLALLALTTLSFATCNQVGIEAPAPATYSTINATQYTPFDCALDSAIRRSDSTAAAFDSIVRKANRERIAIMFATPDYVPPGRIKITRVKPHFGELENRK